MYEGAVILESLRIGGSLEGITLVVRRITRSAIDGTSADQPSVWTILEFEVADDHAEPLAGALLKLLATPGWYADFHNGREIFVVFPDRIFRYPRGDRAARSAAQEHGRNLGIPEPQLDWTN